MLELYHIKKSLRIEKIGGYIRLMRLAQPIGILLLLWPSLMALWIASHGQPSIANILIFTLGVIVMRSAGCVINDIADQKFDPYVQRTRQRPLATQQVTTFEAAILFMVLIAIAFGLVLLLNIYTIILSVIAVLLAMMYPFMKRFTDFPQVVLGAAFGWAIPMTYSASVNTLPVDCWLLFFASMCWITAYDTQYAMVDKVDDEKIGVKSTAFAFGSYINQIVLFLQTMALILWLAVGFYLQMHSWYFVGIAVGIGFLIYQQVLMYKEEYFKAFLNNSWVGLSLFVGTVLNYWLR